jgi:hypothetical protein
MRFCHATPTTRAEVRFAQSVFDCAGDAAQDSIAGFMAVLVVDLLQPVPRKSSPTQPSSGGAVRPKAIAAEVAAAS